MNARTTPGLAHSIEGPDDATTLVFLHGWPDDASLWRHQVAALRDEFRCVVPTLPNFGDTRHETGGCDFQEIVERLHQTISSLECRQVILITHDWGAYIGYLYEKKYPDTVQSMIAMDIGGHFQPATLSAAAMFVSYQWILTGLWLLGGLIPPLATWLTKRFATLLKVPKRQVDGLRSRANYPYFYFWRSNLVPWMRGRLLGNYRPRCPVLFLYGGKKPLMFHSDQWLTIVEQCGGRNVCIADGAHWFMEEQIEQTNQNVMEWLGRADSD